MKEKKVKYIIFGKVTSYDNPEIKGLVSEPIFVYNNIRLCKIK